MHIPIGTKALILSKLYYGVLTKSLEDLEIERYFSILYFLSENNGCTQQHICNNMIIDKTAMVKMIDYLIKAGYVERRVNPEDRREHFIILTKKGQKRTEETVKAFNSIDEQIFSSVSKSDRLIFKKVLNQLSGSLKGLPGNDILFNYKSTKKAALTSALSTIRKTKKKQIDPAN